MSDYTFRPVRPDELRLAVEQNQEAFGGALDTAPQRAVEFAHLLAAGELWGIDDGGRLVGHCRLRAVDHFFGGRPVRCLEVVGVAVPAAHRRSGVATAMMEGATAWGAHRNLGLSLLFPAVPQLYRRLGWEYAGTFPRYAVPAAAAPPAAESMRPALASDVAGIAACHERYAATLPGAGRRTQARWRQLMAGDAQYVLDGASAADAYVLLHHGADPSHGEELAVDWAALNPRGMRAVAALLTQLPDAPVVRGPLPDLTTMSVGSWHVPTDTGLHWMARMLVAPTAVDQRGFGIGVEAAVTLVVDDRLVGGQTPWRLEVSGGRGTLTPARTADVVMDPRAAGPMFTGFRSAQQLAGAGLLDGPAAAVDALTTMFAGPSPVVLDFF